jgi:hypothetical protein
MRIKPLIAAGALAIALGASNAPAEPDKVDIPFGLLVPDRTCPEASHILKFPCPGGGLDFYVAFPKGRTADLATFENQNVALRGSWHATTCTLPLIQVSRIAISAILPPCVEPVGP